MLISQDSYEKEIRLSGLLFFHRISDNRMGGSPIKHLKMFQNLCGTEALKNVVLVTTMWDEVDEEEGNNRESELTSRYWKTMIELGCRTSRFHNNTKSALDIVSQFQDARCTVLLQRELVDLYFELAVTSASQTLFPFRVELIKKIKEFLAHSTNRIAVEKARIVRTLRIANVQRRRNSAPSSVFRRLSIEVTEDPTNKISIGGVETPQAASPIECFPPPSSPADSTVQSGTQMVLQGTITALKLIQQIVGLAPVPGLQSLVGVVLNILEVVNVSFGAASHL